MVKGAGDSSLALGMTRRDCGGGGKEVAIRKLCFGPLRYISANRHFFPPPIQNNKLSFRSEARNLLNSAGK